MKIKYYTVDYHGDDEYRATRTYKVKSLEELYYCTVKEIAAMEKYTIEQVSVAHITWNKTL